MAEIKCPNCGTVISLEQSDLDSVVQQVRDEEFHRALEERAQQFEADKANAIKLAEADAKLRLQQEAALKDAEIERLKALVKAQEETAEANTALRLNEQAALKDAEIERLKVLLESQEEAAEAKRDLAVTQAVAAVEKERDELKASVDVMNAQMKEAEAQHRESLAEKLKEKDDFIAYQQGEIERIKDMKARLSTKMIGESLEQHCQYEFDRIRAVAFPHAYFEKDNDYSQGTKGDFIFREEDEDGNEIISIMFEMKNEEDTASVKKRNEDHFAKLDKDRRQKGCEYAILVSLLEPDSELYNEGIVDVSHRYQKMYVIRPQFFIPIISLLRNAALGSLEYKRELALVKQQELDITNFEADLETFKEGFFRNFKLASDRFDDAIDGIDRTIKLLEKIRDNLTKSENHLTAANNKLEDLTVKKLTRKNPTMKQKFAELEEGEKTEDESQAS